MITVLWPLPPRLVRPDQKLGHVKAQVVTCGDADRSARLQSRVRKFSNNGVVDEEGQDSILDIHGYPVLDRTAAWLQRHDVGVFGPGNKFVDLVPSVVGDAKPPVVPDLKREVRGRLHLELAAPKKHAVGRPSSGVLSIG